VWRRVETATSSAGMLAQACSLAAALHMLRPLLQVVGGLEALLGGRRDDGFAAARAQVLEALLRAMLRSCCAVLCCTQVLEALLRVMLRSCCAVLRAGPRGTAW
jgi:hypothetical protein